MADSFSWYGADVYEGVEREVTAIGESLDGDVIE